MFVINCKNYQEVTPRRIASIAAAAKKASSKYGIKIAIAPPPHMLGQALETGCMVFAQHLDNAKVGNTTGYIVPELAKKAGVAGSLINHSEHRIPKADIEALVSRLRDLSMTSIVCVRDVAEAKRYAGFGPDYIAIEPPELIGSGRAVSKEKPELIVRAASAVKTAKNRTGLLCGAGLVSADDVARATELGSKGILVASGVVKAGSPGRVIESFAKAML